MTTPVHPRHVYASRLERVVDADSLNVIPLPSIKLRLLGFDAAELRGGTEESKAIAREQSAWVSEWLAARSAPTVDGRGFDSFGRELCWVWADGESLNLSFVKRWPEYAANPRLTAERATGETAHSRAQYKP